MMRKKTISSAVIFLLLFSALFNIPNLVPPVQAETYWQAPLPNQDWLVNQTLVTYKNDTYAEAALSANLYELQKDYPLPGQYEFAIAVVAAANTRHTTGYTVDYYPGEKVTVEFYRNLPTHGYKIIILRVHSSATGLQGGERFEGPVVLFSFEPYETTRYVYEQLTDQIFKVSYNVPEPPYYFAITPTFVTSSMKGKFQNTVVVMMGCEGLDNPLMAKAFVEKGAKVYISWNQQVLASHTDLATTHLLQHLLIEKRTVKHAIQETHKEVGADPAYKSLLIAYPIEALDYTIQNIVGNLVTSTIEIQQKVYSEIRP